MAGRLTGTADLPLHTGKAPAWLFSRMRELGGSIAELMIDELGPAQTIRRLSDPFWFQALSCILGFDWHSSGTTTVTLAAMKEGMSERGLPVHIVGGKGRASRSIEEQLSDIKSERISNRIGELARISRLSAKVDGVAVQDGYDIYHHALILDEQGSWAVIQQGMNGGTGYARRYHWESCDHRSMVNEPHSAIVGKHEPLVRDFTAREGEEMRKDLVEIAVGRKEEWYNGMILSRDEHQSLLDDFSGTVTKRLKLDWSANWSILRDSIRRILEIQPSNFEELLLVRGVGKKTLLAIAMAANLVYGDEPSWKDPVLYSFAVGGKDGIPYPVNTRRMEQTAEIIRQAVESARISDSGRKKALQDLSSFFRHGRELALGSDRSA